MLLPLFAVSFEDTHRKYLEASGRKSFHLTAKALFLITLMAEDKNV